jgi:hypothetical protein
MITKEIKMKKILVSAIIIIAAGVSNFAAAQTVPQNIATAFAAKYPNAKADRWKTSKDNYTVEFSSDDKKSLAYYDMNGKWTKTETKIKWTWKLPADMQTAFNKSGYKPWYIEEIKRVDAPDQNEYVFTVDNRVMLDGDHADAFFKAYKLYFKDDSLIKKEIID